MRNNENFDYLFNYKDFEGFSDFIKLNPELISVFLKKIGTCNIIILSIGNLKYVQVRI